MKMHIRFAVLAIAFLALVSCQSQQGSSINAKAAGADTVIVTQDQDGGRVALNPGQTLLVRLPISNDRGMRWEMEAIPNQAVIMPDGQRVVRSNDQVKFDSLIAYEELRFQAQAAGETKLQLNYDHPGLGEGSVQRRFNIDVVVSAAGSR